MPFDNDTSNWKSVKLGWSTIGSNVVAYSIEISKSHVIIRMRQNYFVFWSLSISLSNMDMSIWQKKNILRAQAR